MTEQESHGWKNRQTWNIVLWLMNEEPLYRACAELAARYAKMGSKVSPAAARRLATDLMGSKTPDGYSVGPRADWKAIADAIT